MCVRVCILSVFFSVVARGPIYVMCDIGQLCKSHLLNVKHLESLEQGEE